MVLIVLSLCSEIKHVLRICKWIGYAILLGNKPNRFISKVHFV